MRMPRATTGYCATSQRRGIVVATAFGSPWTASTAFSAGKPADSQPSATTKRSLSMNSASGAAGETAAGAVTESPPYNPGLFGRLALANFRQKLVE
ncbi:unnamed protein product, partial [Closterium sp. NIES-54]